MKYVTLSLKENDNMRLAAQDIEDIERLFLKINGVQVIKHGSSDCKKNAMILIPEEMLRSTAMTVLEEENLAGKSDAKLASDGKPRNKLIDEIAVD